MKKTLAELKNIFPIDYNYINYLKTISPSIDSNINFNTFVKIIVAFVGSIFFSDFILSYTPLTTNLYFEYSILFCFISNICIDILKKN